VNPTTKEKQTANPDKPVTLESRAAARALLDSNKPPDIVISFFGEDEHKTATVGERTFTRGADESVAAFELRIADQCPVIGPPNLIVMWGSETTAMVINPALKSQRATPKTIR